MKKHLLLGSALTTAAFITTPAFAQDGDEATGASDVIIVSAQRREQELLDVPVAVTSMNAEALDEKQIDDVYDVVTTNPSVSGVTGNLSSPLHNTPIRIRGIGTGGGNPGFEGAVGMYVDEIYRSRAGAAILTFFDMAGVDILRGPQGTLFGKNTTAGAIVQRTAAPEVGEVGAYWVGEYGNYNTWSLEGMVNYPLGENGALRVSGIIDRTDGFFTDPVGGADDIADTRTNAVRAQLAYDLSDRLDVRVIGDFSNYNSGSNYNQSTRVDNRDPGGVQSGSFAPLALGLAFPGSGTGYWYWDIFTPGDPARPFDREISNQNLAISNQEISQYGIGGFLNYDVSDNLNLRSITSYREIDSDNLNGDWDFGPVALAGRLDDIQDFQTFSQELIATGDFAAGGIDVDWTAGVHYFNETIDYTRIATNGPVFSALFAGFGGIPGLAPYGNVNTAFQDVTYSTEEESWGIFGHASINLTDSLSVVGGLRWNQIDKDATYVNNNGEGATYFDFVTANNFGFILADAALATAFNWENSTSNEELTYNVALQLRPTDDIQLYASYARGFKAGGFNMTENAAAGDPSVLDPNAVPLTGVTEFVTLPAPVGGPIPRLYRPFDPDLAIFAPEFVDSYELGARYQFPGGLVSLTGFWSDYSDLQVSVFTGLVFQVVNAGSARTRGIELEGQYDVTDNLSINGGVTFLDAEYGTDVTGLPGGRTLVQSPDVSLALGANYVKPISPTLDLFTNLNFSYVTEYFAAEGGCQDAAGTETLFADCDPSLTLPNGATPNALANEIQDGYGLFNGRLGVRTEGGVEVSLFCNNCFDTEYYSWRFNQPFVSGGLLGNPAAPRTWGGRVRMDF